MNKKRFFGIIILMVILTISATQSVDEIEYFKGTKLLAEQGDAEAQCSLGLCYQNGYGTTQDKEAVKWYLLASEQNNVNSKYNLGICYAIGAGRC